MCVQGYFYKAGALNPDAVVKASEAVEVEVGVRGEPEDETPLSADDLVSVKDAAVMTVRAQLLQTVGMRAMFLFPVTVSFPSRCALNLLLCTIWLLTSFVERALHKSTGEYIPLTGFS
jgi:hypothetical protein